MTSPTAGAHAASPLLSPRRRAIALAVVATAFVLDLLDVTIVNVALPSIGHALSAGAGAIAWIVAGYALAFAVLLILGGRLGDLLGHRVAFLWGVAAFTLSSAACGLATSAEGLVAARAAQGAFAALMVPQVMALMQLLYAPHERMRAFAIFGLLGGVSSALGPILGGLLMDADPLGLGWRVVFLINLPVGVLALAAGAWLLPRDTASHGAALDLAGTAWSLVAALAWTVPLMQGPESGWTPPLLLALAAAPVLTAGLWRHCLAVQARGGVPIVRPALLADANYRRGLALSLLTNGVVTAQVFLLTLAWQLGAGISPTRMSLMCVPIAIGAMLSISWIGNLVFARIGARSVILGLAMQGAGVVLMALVAAGAFGEAGLLALSVPSLASQALIGLGLGFSGPASTTATLAGVPRAEAGGASGVLNAVRQLSAVLLVAIVTGFMHAGAGRLGGVAIYLAGVPVLCAALVLGAVVSWRLAAPQDPVLDAAAH